MAEDSFRRFYARSDFASLTGNVIAFPLLQTLMLALNPSLSQHIAEMRELPGETGVVLEWRVRPSDADLVLVDAAIAGFVGGTTTSQPFSFASPGVTTAPNATLVTKIDDTSGPLDGGTYSLTYQDGHRLQSAAVGDSAGVKLTITVSGFPPFSPPEDEWPFVLKHAYNYAVPIVVSAGQTIRMQSQVYKLGAGAAIAEVSKARFTLDKIG